MAWLLCGLGYRLDNRGIEVRFLAGVRVFFFTETSRSALGTSQPPSQGVLEALNPDLNDRNKKLTIHLYLAPRLRMSVAVLPDPLTSSCRVLETNHILPLILLLKLNSVALVREIPLGHTTLGRKPLNE